MTSASAPPLAWRDVPVRLEADSGPAYCTSPFHRLVDDPVPRDSRQSYFLQLADLAAYAAFRRLYPPPPRPAQIVPHRMWDELATSRFQAGTSGAKPFGIVHNGGPLKK
jgi:Protein of unknown function (DUF3800)